MSYVAISQNLKHVHSISLELMSPEEMQNMSFGEVLTSETINYRTGTPQMNGLFCQAIFGPVKNWECACGKYKRYRYAGVICDKCGVEVSHSSVRRERMGHISLAAPCAHPWFFRIIPSRIALMLDMKTTDVSRVVYFSAYIITEINKPMLEEYLGRIDNEAKARVNGLEMEYDAKFEELSKLYQKEKSANPDIADVVKVKYESDKEKLKDQKSEHTARIETISEIAKKELGNLDFKQVITEMQYQELAQKFGPVFKAMIGAEAIESLLKKVDLEPEEVMLKEKVAKSKGEARRKLVKRLKLIKYFIDNNSKPEWMILHRVMVLPPDLRPMLQLDGGRFATSDLNELYRRLINRNNRLRKLIQIGAPEVILRNEKRMLQEAVEALIDNAARGGKQVMASTGARRPLKSLTDVLKGKQGRFRQNLLGKRVDYSGRSVIVVGPQLTLDYCGLPKEMALELFTPFLIGGVIKKSEEGQLAEEDQAFNVHSAKRLIEARHPVIYDILEEVIKDKYVLLNRAPTLHKLSFMAFKPTLIEGRAIQLHPLACNAFNADFDGDQMAVHLPITLRGQQEAKELMVASKNLLKPATGDLILSGKQDVILGSYYLTALTNPKEEKDMKLFASMSEVLLALDHDAVTLGEPVITRIKNKETGEKERIITTAGRIIFSKAFPTYAPFFNFEVNKKVYDRIMNDAYHTLGAEVMPQVLDNIKNLAFKYVTSSGITLSAADIHIPAGKHALIEETRNRVDAIQGLHDLGLMSEQDKYQQTITTWSKTVDDVTELVKEKVDPLGNIGLMINSGSRGNISQLNQMAGMKGLAVTPSGRVMELPAQHGFIEGLSSLEYFVVTRGSRKSQADVSLKTADSGYLTRRLVDVAQNMIINTLDVGEQEGKYLSKETSDKLGKTVWQRAYGRYLLKDVVVGKKTVIKAGELLDYKTFGEVKDLEIDGVWIYSITQSPILKGIDQRSYGMDFSDHKPVKLGTAVGILAAQSLGEPSTQLTMNSKHKGGVLSKSDITSGLPRVEEIFEARIPKAPVPIADFDGEVAKIEGSLDTGFQIIIKRDGTTLALPFEGGQVLQIKEGATVAAGEAVIIKANGEAVLAPAPGVVESDGGKVVIRTDKILLKEYFVSPGIQLSIKEGDMVKRAQLLAEGHADLQELMDKAGLNVTEDYIISELLGVYGGNGIDVNEKHIEIIIRQMTSRAFILDPGDTDFTPGDTVGTALVIFRNKELVAQGLRPAVFKRLITGISRASLATDSFLSAASFQETARVLVEAVVSSRPDNLAGLKENVILGQLIPAGTGYTETRITQVVQEEFEAE
jgi:DNA-directed RNA polymerase subunit beta'